MGTYILTVVISFSGMTSYTVEYSNKAACEAAKEVTRSDLVHGRILLLTCTSKG